MVRLCALLSVPICDEVETGSKVQAQARYPRRLEVVEWPHAVTRRRQGGANHYRKDREMPTKSQTGSRKPWLLAATRGGQGPAIPSPTGSTRGAGKTPGPGSDGTREAWRDREMAFLAVPWRLSQRRLARGAGGERMTQRTNPAGEMLPWVGWFGGPDGFGARYAVVRCM